MGQKTHPLGFRVGIVLDHKSNWYANFNTYSNFLKEDDEIRTCLNLISKKDQKDPISNVYIYRTNNNIEINIETGEPVKLTTKYKKVKKINNNIAIDIETGEPIKLIGKDIKKSKDDNILYIQNTLYVENIINKIKKKFPPNRKLIVNISEVKNMYLNAALLASFIVEQLEKRVPFRLAMQNALRAAEKNGVTGIKIQVSGRLNGAEIARKEWIRQGRVPLQTLRAVIDYATKEANTKYGILGVKIWLFKTELWSNKKV